MNLAGYSIGQSLLPGRSKYGTLGRRLKTNDKEHKNAPRVPNAGQREKIDVFVKSECLGRRREKNRNLLKAQLGQLHQERNGSFEGGLFV